MLVTLTHAAYEAGWLELRHCEERSDEAIHLATLLCSGSLRGACHRVRIARPVGSQASGSILAEVDETGPSR
jgi:hypothetical protein